jgi:hypothetical protein
MGEGRFVAPATPANEEGVLVLACRLVTLGEVAGRLQGIRRLILRPDAILTPAVKDDLRNRNIEVTFAAAARSAARRLRVAIVSAQTPISANALADALRAGGFDVGLDEVKCLSAAVGRIATEVAEAGVVGVLFTGCEAESLCLVNRRRGVRAVLGRDAAQVAADAASVGANVVVVNPNRTPTYLARKVVEQFCRGAPRTCPEDFDEQVEP